MSERFERNILVPEIGAEGQLALKRASCAVVGLGGLGSPAAMYLAAAGIGRLGLIDGDEVEESNLQRQVLHSTADVGRAKVESAKDFLTALNPELELELFPLRLDKENAAEILSDYDCVIDATDNFESKFLLNDICLELAIPLATAGILGLAGQMMLVLPNNGPCLRCAIGDVPSGVPTTSELGVLGAVAGILGTLQAAAIIGHIVGYMEDANKLHTVDVRTMWLRTLELRAKEGCACEIRSEV